MLARKKVADQTPALLTSVSKKIFAYTKTGLVQLQDKIVARFALTIYPYSLGYSSKIRIRSVSHPLTTLIHIHYVIPIHRS